jgi:predicted RNase H-like nuclease (RuvC/YqgF family)
MTFLDIPQSLWVGAFLVLFGAAVTGIVTKVRSDRAADRETLAQAEEIAGGQPMTVKEARKVVSTNTTLQRTVDALQTCNDSLERELKLVNDSLADYKNQLQLALGRIDELEAAIRVMKSIRAVKSRRIAEANQDQA